MSIHNKSSTSNAIDQQELQNQALQNEEEVLVDDPAALTPQNTTDSYEGRKHDSEIDGPQQKSQETDEIYSDPRKEEDLPPGGKNVSELNTHDLSQEGNEP